MNSTVNFMLSFSECCVLQLRLVMKIIHRSNHLDSVLLGRNALIINIQRFIDLTPKTLPCLLNILVENDSLPRNSLWNTLT